MKDMNMTLEAQTTAAPVATIKDADAEQARQRSQAERDLTVRLAAASVADAIGLMMRSERHRHYSLADLEWLLLPALMLEQVMFAYMRPKLAEKPSKAQGDVAGATEKPKNGAAPDVTQLPPIAVAMLTWAAVSPEVAAKLDAQKKAGAPHRLAPNEWRSGKEVRVIEMLGEEKAAKELVEKLRKRFGHNENDSNGTQLHGGRP